MPQIVRLRGVTTRTTRPVPAIRVVWPNLAEPRATLIHTTPSGRQRERKVGPRALLTLDEAAAALNRSPEGVRRSIRAGFLRSVRRGGRRYVTMRACAEYRCEAEADLAAARPGDHGPLIPAEEVYRRAGL